MPLTTNFPPPSPPTIPIDVENGGGGGGPTAVVVVCASWDPARLKLRSVGNPRGGDYQADAEDGYCIWYGHAIAWNSSKRFRLNLCRKAAGPTWIVAFAMDPRTGDWSDPRDWQVPATFTICRGTGRRKAKKKAKKKGRKKA